MKVIKRKLQISPFFKAFLCLFISQVSFAQVSVAKEYMEIKVPSFMQGVETEAGQDKIYLEYEGGVSLNKDVNSLKKGKIELFIKRLWKTYQENDQETFKKLFTDQGRTQLAKLSKSEYQREWKTLSGKKKAVLNSYFPYMGGTVVNWTIGEIPRGLFVVEENNKLKIDAFEGKSSDKEFHNRSLYFTYLPTGPKSAEIVTALEPHKGKYKLSAKVDEERPILHVLKRGKERWETIVSLKDNEKEKGRFDDDSSRPNYITVNFKKEHFSGNEVDLLILKSNFPLDSYPFTLKDKESLNVPAH